jgi:hypothetical protein
VIVLLPVAQQATTEPESTYPSSASLVSRSAYSHHFPCLQGASQDSSTYMHHQNSLVSRPSRERKCCPMLRNLSCRRARQSDVTSQRDVNCDREQQCITGDSKTTIGSGHLQPREPIVMVERLEVEVHRYGRIVPTSNGSYRVLNTSELESTLYVPARSFRVGGGVARVHTEMVRVRCYGSCKWCCSRWW